MVAFFYLGTLSDCIIRLYYRVAPIATTTTSHNPLQNLIILSQTSIDPSTEKPKSNLNPKSNLISNHTMVIQNQSHQWIFGDVGLTLREDIQWERPEVLLILVMWVISLAMAEVTKGGIRERERETMEYKEK